MANSLQTKLNVSLYDNVLTPEKDDYIAKVQLNGTMTNADIARDIVAQRSEFRYDTILNILNLGSEIKRTRLANGFSVNDGVTQMHANVTGRFIGSSAQFDSEQHAVGLTSVASPAMRQALNETKVVVQGPAQVGPVIDRVEDVYSQTINETLTPGRILKIQGHHLRIGGEDPANGIFFISVTDPTQQVKVDERDIADNNPSQLTIAVPALTPGSYYLEVVTQSSTNKALVKTPRSYRFDLELSVL